MGVLSDNRSQIVNGGLISASFVSDLYDVFTGNVAENLNFSGSVNITGSLIGNLTGTADTASYVETAQTASYVLNAVSASYSMTAVTASHALNAVSSSYAETASYSVVTLIDSSSLADSASYASTASYVETAQTASYVLNAVSASYAPAPAPTLPYKVYTAKITQNGSGVTPTVNEVYLNTFDNDVLPVAIVGTGVLAISSLGNEFISGKTVALIQMMDEVGLSAISYNIVPSFANYRIVNSAGAVKDFFTAVVEIRVYN